MSLVAIYLIFSMLFVICSDVTRYLIPNWLVGSLLVCYPLAIFMFHAPLDWLMALSGMVLVFIVGYFIFAMRWMGGGDIKLITVLALWVGWQHLPDFIIIFALYGGVFAMIIWLVRKALPFVPRKTQTLPRILREGEPVPYGVAIALGFLTMMGMGEIPGVALAL
jgi:prepilin peptidase CpaA